ncbi:phage tail tube protein [Parasedimentitalea psychrophila]|uniref:Phage tail tube protein n=1 Tax=Parasedimentitalea psychrophila TaxID=2997337 RepID=A0A9Y2L017_9RHOB|nr:phage tail tube protein [Parasedimentitalea psychrophila]WIY25062.1 phage tail tube protein [Parasedimentitalea psychrophila]
MAAPKFWKNKRMLFALESTYGVDPGPTGAANAVLAMDVTYKPMEGQDQERDLEQPGMSANGTIPTDLHATISFSVDLSASGVAGTAPAWGALLRACGVAETISAGVSIAYTPISESFESGTFHLVIDKTRYVLLGARGTAEFDLSAQATPKIKFDFTGLFAIPTEVSAPSVVLSAWKEPKIVSAQNTPVFTIDATPFVMSSAKLTLGNKVEPRFLVNSDRVLITDKSEGFETTVEAQPLTDFDPFTMAANMEQVAVNLVHGTVGGSIATLSLATAQMQRPSLSQSQNIKEWPLRLIPRAASENDQWSLTLT